MPKISARAVGPVALMAFTGLTLCSSAVVVGLWLSSPAPSKVGAIPPDLPGAKAVEFPSGSGRTVHGWWVPGRVPGGGVVLLLHGVRANRLMMVERARMLQANGFSSLLIDFQAHGESAGRRITFGKLESLDAAAAVSIIRDRLPNERVGVIGVSLGGAAALLGPTPLHVDALVLESVFPDIDAALGNRLRANLGPLLGSFFTPILVPTFDLVMPPFLGARPDELRPIDRIGSIGAPVLVASGTIDPYTPLTEAKSLFDRAREPKLFWPVSGAAHVDLERHDPERYREHVLSFLELYLRPTDAQGR